MDLIIRRRISLFGHVAKLGKDIPAHQALQRQINVFLIALGNVRQVAQEASGWIRFVLTTTSHLLIHGDAFSVEVRLG